MPRKLVGASHTISPCETYRYTLTIPLGASLVRKKGEVVFIMLNPSTANALESDNTVTRCMNFARDWGYNTLQVLNLYAYRSPYPKDLIAAGYDVGPDNNHWLELALKAHKSVICAWGNGAQESRVQYFLERAAAYNTELLCLGLTENGSPRHPLYVKKNTGLTLWAPAL